MELEVPRVWLRLTFDLRSDGGVVVGAADSRGRSVVPPRPRRRAYEWDTVQADLPGREWTVRVQRPLAVLDWYRELSAMLPPARIGGQFAPLVPVFVSAPRQLRAVPVDSLVAATLGPPPPGGPGWVVIDDRAAGESLPPFRLPLVVLGVGDWGIDALTAARDSPWFGRDDDLQAHLAEAAWVDEPADAARSLAERDVDILLIDAFDAAELAAEITTTASGRVRLAIVAGSGGPPELQPRSPSELPARSVLTVSGSAAGHATAMTSFFLNISHDLPLHEVFDAVRRAGPAGVRLSASPASLHDLRLTSAWAAVEESVAAFAGIVGPGRIGPDRLSDPVVQDLVTDVGAAREFEVHFAQERTGLLQIAQARQHVASAERALAALARREPTGRQEPSDRERVFNVALRRTGDQVVPPDTTSIYVEPSCSLAAGERYDLVVQIGAAWAANLVTGDQEPIDLLLPDNRDGHELHAAVFSDTVEIVGPAVLPLRLAPAGPSDTATFGIVTRTPGPAWARVSLFHRDNLLQTYRLDLLVDGVEQRHPAFVVRAELQHSATRDWGNLEALGPRALSITLNAGPAGDHRLFLKVDDVASAVGLTEQRLQSGTDAIRGILSQTVDGKLDSPTALWKIATQGQELFRALFERLGPAATDALRRLQAARDQIVQVIRADTDQSLPWALVYDWPLPERCYGDPPPPVCFGTADGGDRCTHGPADRVVCVNGLWGVRHYLEELLPAPHLTDLPQRVAITDPSVLVALGLADEQTGDLVGRLSRVLRPRHVRRVGARERFLDRLFDGERPSVVVVLGHHETRLIFGEPEGSRIALLTADRWLKPANITDRRVEAGDWRPPHSLVMLLSCRTAAAGPTELTSFLSAFNGVRAGAVIGTECDVYSDLAADFATAVLSAMSGPDPGAGGLPFAAAVRAARRSIVIDKEDTRGLVFAAFGPANLAFLQP